MTLDEATRRQLRFSMLLQAAGFVLFLAAFVVRFLNSGLDALSVLFAVAAAVTGTAALLIRRTLHRA